ncbi:MAG: hypothetical protein IKP36_12710 [Bacteroidaceae bacterium]|jgi:hypothetical protein|nr:hypothetical protein [Bacteroidaceae bacterium]
MSKPLTPAARLRRKEIKEEAKRLLCEKVLTHPYFPHDIYINVSGIKEWLNQPHIHYAEKNESLLLLPKLLANAEYLGSTTDPKRRDYVIASHIFKTTIADDNSWIIVNENIWGECLVHSISDNYVHTNKEQDL